MIVIKKKFFFFIKIIVFDVLLRIIFKHDLNGVISQNIGRFHRLQFCFTFIPWVDLNY